jgi:hypothetical protein
MLHCRPGNLIVLTAAIAVGCSYAGEEAADTRRIANQAYGEGLAAFNAKDRALAEQKFTTAIDAGGLNPDSYVDAAIKRAVCWGAASKFDEALAELAKLESGGGPLDQILAARSYILAKQGKAAEARAALAQARRYNRTVQEFKD